MMKLETISHFFSLVLTKEELLNEPSFLINTEMHFQQKGTFDLATSLSLPTPFFHYIAFPSSFSPLLIISIKIDSIKLFCTLCLKTPEKIRQRKFKSKCQFSFPRTLKHKTKIKNKKTRIQQEYLLSFFYLSIFLFSLSPIFCFQQYQLPPSTPQLYIFETFVLFCKGIKKIDKANYKLHVYFAMIKRNQIKISLFLFVLSS